MSYWDRTIDSFSDEIITTPAHRGTGRVSKNYWYAGFDCSPLGYPSDPDYGYAGCGKTPEDAVKSMANAIREHLPNARGDLLQRCLKWWTIKELGLDKTDPVLIDLQEHWHLNDAHSIFWGYEIKDPENLDI